MSYCEQYFNFGGGRQVVRGEIPRQGEQVNGILPVCMNQRPAPESNSNL